MDDEKIISLYFERDEGAIRHTKEKYGKAIRLVCFRVLRNDEDAEECENDTYLGAWNSIPPEHPEHLAAYLAKIARNLSVATLRGRSAGKRGGGESFISELDESFPDVCEEQREKVANEELSRALNSFLDGLKPRERQVFVCRYWRCDSIGEICTLFGFSQSKVKTMLMRTRNKLREYLEKEGIVI